MPVLAKVCSVEDPVIEAGTELLGGLGGWHAPSPGLEGAQDGREERIRYQVVRPLSCARRAG